MQLFSVITFFVLGLLALANGYPHNFTGGDCINCKIPRPNPPEFNPQLPTNINLNQDQAQAQTQAQAQADAQAQAQVLAQAQTLDNLLAQAQAQGQALAQTLNYALAQAKAQVQPQGPIN